MDQALPLQRRTWRRNSFEDRVMAESTQTRPGIDSELDRITELLREARARTIRLIEPLSDAIEEQIAVAADQTRPLSDKPSVAILPSWRVSTRMPVHRPAAGRLSRRSGPRRPER